jgi:GrpB-like predicted nucleotidyltransferase (UPF0157 family)
MRDPIIITGYDPAWPQRFEELAARALAALSPIEAHIEQVGSTSVPGLSAEPVIDLDVVVEPACVPQAMEQLAAIGYVHEGDGGLPGREAFRWPPGEPRHHLYLCTPDTLAFREHILFRDYLRAHPTTAREYEGLERALAGLYAEDRRAYQEGKAEFINTIIRRIADATAS